MDKHKQLKKFAFHNGEGVMKSFMRSKAEELGYDVIKAGQSHAEGQFLQFLLERSKKLNNYTHIVGMGCSKKHCSECDALLSLLLGNNYHKVTSSVKHSKKTSSSNPKYTYKKEKDKSNEAADGKVHIEYAKILSFDIVLGEEAVDKGAVYAKFYLTEGLQNEIKKLAPGVNLLEPRFNKSDEPASKMEKMMQEIENFIETKLKELCKEEDYELLEEENISKIVEYCVEKLIKNRKLIKNSYEEVVKDAAYEEIVRIKRLKIAQNQN